MHTLKQMAKAEIKGVFMEVLLSRKKSARWSALRLVELALLMNDVPATMQPRNLLRHASTPECARST
jgi:hypothetical protein